MLEAYLPGDSTSWRREWAAYDHTVDPLLGQAVLCRAGKQVATVAAVARRSVTLPGEEPHLAELLEPIRDGYEFMKASATETAVFLLSIECPSWHGSRYVLLAGARD
jgi:hypothetical protein